MRRLLLGLGAMLVLGCSNSGLSGTYAAEMPGQPGKTSELATYEFSPNGKVVVSVFGQKTEIDYEVEGDRVKIKSNPAGPAQILTLKEDGSIEGPMGIRMVKKES